MCVPSPPRPPVAFFVQFQQSCEEVGSFVPLFIDCVNIAKRRRRSGGTYSSPRGGGGGGRYRGGEAGRVGKAGEDGQRNGQIAYKRPQLSPHPLPRAPRREPGGAAAGRAVLLPRPVAAAAQHRPAGSEERRAEPSGGAAPLCSERLPLSVTSTSIPR